MAQPGIGIAILAILAVLLYADLLSVHQIHRITQAMIDAAPDAVTRQALVEDRNERDRGEWKLKLFIGTGLALDVAALPVLAVGLLRLPRNRSTGGHAEGM
ncbi:MAG TPA: hypothetical protein VKZ53_27525 [Candidatus Angelobacter sp.]|nr:hypothetical protein [Candidatus Angelobacter sp.]